MYAQVHILNNDNITIDFSKKDINSVNTTIIQSLTNPKYGDLVEDYSKSGYRTNGLYIINKNINGDLIISNISHDYDDYGNIGDNFTLCDEFPPGYWTFALEKNYYGKMWWHRGTQEEPVSKDIWGLITENDLIEQILQIYKHINNFKDKVLIDEDICDVQYNWGILRFYGTKSTVQHKLNILKKDSYITNLYFIPSRDIFGMMKTIL